MNFNHSYFNIFVTLFVTLNFQDVDVIEHLNKQKSVSSYILNLIKEDIKKQGE